MNVIFSCKDEKNIKYEALMLGIWAKSVTFASEKTILTAMNILKKSAEIIWRSQVLKYTLVVAGGVVLVGFVGENSMLSHVQNKKRINELQSEIDKYRKKYQRDYDKLDRLNRDPRAIEEIAREHYFMKRDDEDIFVFAEEGEGNEQKENEKKE